MKRYIITTLLVGFVFLLSCKKEDKIAPDLKEISGPVDFEEDLKVSTANPNFSTGEKVYFSAKFKTDTYWVVTIVGSPSGATKTFTGTGREISVTNATWDGTANSLPSFRAEAITITVSFPKASSVNTTAPLTFTGTIAGTKNLDEGGVLITNFATLPIYNVYSPLTFANVPPASIGSNWGVTTTQQDLPLISPDGNKYLTMGPTPVWQENINYLGHKDPYLDHMEMPIKKLGYSNYFPLIADPGKIFFNIMVHNTNSNSKARLQVTLFEENAQMDTIGKSYDIMPRWSEGWKQLSIPYKDFKPLDTTNISYNPQRIVGLQLTYLSTQTQLEMDAPSPIPVESISFDHLIFTHYKPYQP